MRVRLVVAVAAMVACVGVWTARHQLPLVRSMFAGTAAAAAEPAPVPVTVVTAKDGDVPSIIAGIGVASSLQSVTVRSRVDGEITDVAFTEGQFVKAGDVLAQIDERQLQAALDGAVAKEAQDQSALQTARADGDRYQALAKKGIVAPQALDEKTASVTQLQAAVASDQASVSSARTALGYATIRAPISGRTGFRSVDKGNVVNSSNDAIVTITQLAPIGVTFVAPGERFGEIRDALKNGIADVEALSTDGSHVLARGKLTLMDNYVNSQNGSIKLKATFDNQDSLLWPGLPVATRLTVAIRHGVVIPDKSLERDADGLSAYVVGSDNKAVRRQVEAGVVTDGFTVVTKGVAAGERVVYDGLGQISDGATVAIGPAPTVAPPAYDSERAPVVANAAVAP